MHRLALLLALTVPLLAASCSSDCRSPLDCKSREVCYLGSCVPAGNSRLSCGVDDDCGPPLANGTRSYVCFVGRCTLRSTPVVTSTRTDSSVADLGFADAVARDAPAPDAPGNPDAVVFPDAMSLPDASTSTDAGP